MEPFEGEYQPVSFDELANHLAMEGSERSPSYVHGGICGIYAGAGAVHAEDCLAASAQALELALQGELAESCLMLAGATLVALQDEEFAFHLLLPDDDVDIGQRVQALAEWCRGFLAAYALVISETSAAGLESEAGESLGDIAAIAEAMVDAEADEEESERHLFEVSEYLRFATLNLFMSRQDANESDPDGAPRSRS
jgi:uncharacterized protein YgfB (UPF0149 family)